MLNFDEYVTNLEERREEEKLAARNEELLRRLTERTYEDAVQELYASLTFRVGVGDMYPIERATDFEVIVPTEEERELELAV